MRKLSIWLLGCCACLFARGQLVVILQSPPSGYTYKPQLWTMVLTNTSNAPINLHIEVSLNTINTSQQVLSGVTRMITLAPGTTQLTATQVMPVQYNIAPGFSNADVNPIGLLPIGRFDACYHFFKHASDDITEIAEQCQEITAEPLSPPQLIYPYDGTAIEETRPQLSWLPPLPVQLFTNLRYDLTLVEMNPNQSAADAIQQNMPLYQGLNLSSNALLYPLSAAALQYDKTYAWRVTAKSNDAPVGISETWQFSLKQFDVLATVSGPQPYVQLRKDPETAYAIFNGTIKFSYANETSDSTWKVRITELSNASRNSRELPLDTLPLLKGLNMINYNALDDPFFTDKHLYQLELFNSRNEIWRLRFEYRRPNELAN